MSSASPLPEGRADGRCPGAISIKGEHYACDNQYPHDGWACTNGYLGAIWHGTAPVVAVPGREAVAVAIAKAADWEQCFNLPYDDDGSTSDTEDRDYFRRLADAALAVVAVPEAGEGWLADCENCGHFQDWAADRTCTHCGFPDQERMRWRREFDALPPDAPVVGEREEKP